MNTLETFNADHFTYHSLQRNCPIHRFVFDSPIDSSRKILEIAQVKHTEEKIKDMFITLMELVKAGEVKLSDDTDEDEGND